MEFFTNTCFVCKATKNVKRCRRCQMISFCGTDHQKQNFPLHKHFCKLISTIMKEKKLSHIYEDLRNVDSITWNQKRIEMISLVKLRLGRPILAAEQEMLEFPRACFVCHDTRQNLLTNCSGCPSATFCKEHPSSSRHDKECCKIKYCFEVDQKLETYLISTETTLTKWGNAILEATSITDSLKPPSSMKEYLFQYLQLKADIPEEVKIAVSAPFSTSLTIFNAFQKLNYRPVNEMVIHMYSGWRNDMYCPWEILFHFMPNVKVLTIVVVEQEILRRQQLPVCAKCYNGKKRLFITLNNLHYLDYMKHEDYRKPDAAVFYNIESPLDGKRHLDWEELMDTWKQIRCPLILTTSTEQYASVMSQSFKSKFKDSLICYDGKNEFGSLNPILEWTDLGVSMLNQFVIVTKDPESRGKTDESYSSSKLGSK